MIERKIRVGYPKGNVHGKARHLVEKRFNISFPKEKLHIENDDYDIFFLKHRDIARLVVQRTLDFGVTSEEWLQELNVEKDVNVLKKLD